MPYRRITDPARLQALLEAVLLIDSDLLLEVLLQRIVEAACSLTGARYGALGVLDERERRFEKFVTVGVTDAEIAAIGHIPAGKGLLGTLIDRPEPLRLEEISSHPDAIGFPPGHPPMHTLIGAPIRIKDEVYGNLYLSERLDGAPFDELDLDVVGTLAIAAGIAIANARLHERVSELSVAADRDRIARDLHDTVIQRLYGIGLSLQGLLSFVEGARSQQRMQQALDEIDNTIVQVRTTIFELEDSSPGGTGLRSRVLALVNESSRALRFDPEVRLIGPLDTQVSTDLAGQVLAVLREALSNVARHAAAASVVVEVQVGRGQLALDVADDGVGIATSDRPGSGIANMGRRAEALGGTFAVTPGATGGTELRWRIPL